MTDSTLPIAIGTSIGGLVLILVAGLIVCALLKSRSKRAAIAGRGGAPLKALDREQASAVYDVIPDAPVRAPSSHYARSAADFKLPSTGAHYCALQPHESHYESTATEFKESLHAPESAYDVFTTDEAGKEKA